MRPLLRLCMQQLCHCGVDLSSEDATSASILSTLFGIASIEELIQKDRCPLCFTKSGPWTDKTQVRLWRLARNKALAKDR